MKKKQAKNSHNFLWLLLAIIIVSFVILQPKLSTWALPFERQIIWQNFIKDTQKNNKIDARNFWEFREFFYPGSFIFKRDGLSQKQTNDQLKKLNISLKTTVTSLPFLIFNSGKLESLEVLVGNNDLNSVINNLNVDSRNIIYKNSSSIIYYDENKTAEIIFLKPTDEMVTANGFYSYRNKDDIKIYTGKYWLSISRVNLN